MEEKVNILHLSDIHFGFENEEEVTLIAQRDNVLSSLIKKISNVNSDWRPDIIVVSGDIGWKGIATDYNIAKDWLSQLVSTLELSNDKIVLCAGNHDIDRNKTVGMDYTDSSKKADEWLKIENIENFERAFDAFSKNCDELKIPPLKISKKDSYLVGSREIDGLQFIILNSAWFCRSDNDKDKLWLGLPQLELLNSDKLLVSDEGYDDDKITISVVHHPKDWLNQNETNSYSGRPNTYKYLSEKCHFILSGHVHGSIEKPHRIHNRAYLFTAGATYADKYYANNFSIIQIDKTNRKLSRKSFEYKPNDDTWLMIEDNETYSLTKPGSTKHSFSSTQRAYNYNELIKKSKEQVQKYIANKSKAIARTKELPELIKRKILWHSSEERIIPDKSGKLKLNTENNISTLEEMVSVEKPTFLFGELGSGKSTLVGQYAINLASSSTGIIPILIPASFFSGKHYQTITDVINLVDDFVNNQVDVSENVFSILTALESKNEITLIIDGFDELDISEAQKLLIKLSDIRDRWASLRIISTGRPIELKGLNYSNWQCLEMFPLTNNELMDILINEALADNLMHEKAVTDAKTKKQFLDKRPELLGITTTPLAVRLIRPFLNENSTNKSLGDLIYEIVLERIGNWDIKDFKEDSFNEFKKIYPDSLSRESLLGIIAHEIFISKNKSITSEQLHELLKDTISIVIDNNKIISQAQKFFENCILQKENDKFLFPSQPILQCALGIYIYEELLKENDTENLIAQKNLWREFSFAATIARRKNKIPSIRNSLFTYLDGLLEDRNYIPAIAFIVSESEDNELAEHFIKLLKKLEFRPLIYFHDIKTQSVRTIAHSIYLAGEKGFDWFYEEYLNPIYPSGLNHDDEHYFILQHWFTFWNFNIPEYHLEKLSRILQPHLDARDWACHNLPKTLVMVLPKLYSKENELLMYVSNIDSSLFSDRANSLLLKEYESGNEDSVSSAIQRFFGKNESIKISILELWLDLFPKSFPKEIIKAIISSINKEKGLVLLNKLKKELGEKKLRSILRFYSFSNSKLATYASICLYKLGEENFYLLSEGLLQGLHDGGKIENAENILHDLIIYQGLDGLFWLVHKFGDNTDIHSGAHSAYWRILLSELNKTDKIHTELFSKTIPYLGEFILPRYPEIRLNFKKLLTNKIEYKDCLVFLLDDFDKSIRYNAACILLACFPESEIKACEIVIKSAVQHYRQTEWLRFCLRLTLGSKVINHIASFYQKLLPVSKTFALTLLYHNQYSLSDDEFDCLVNGLISEGARFDESYTIHNDSLPRILSDNKSYKILLQNLYNDNIAIAKNAASSLLMFHKDKLDDKDFGFSWGIHLYNMFSYWHKDRIDDEIQNIMSNNIRYEYAKQALSKIQKEKNKEPLISLYLRSKDSLSVWKDILWYGLFYFDHLDSDSIARSCFWIFSKSRKNSYVANIIGNAAVEFLAHPSFTQERMYNDVIPWLTFLAHEYGNLDTDKVELAILNYRPIRKEIISALISRLGKTPSNYISPRDGSLYLIFSKRSFQLKEEITLQKIIDATRDSEEIHPSLINLIEVTLLTNSFTVSELEKIADRSKFGTLYSIVVLFSRNERIKTEWFIKIIGLEPTRNIENNLSARYVIDIFPSIISSRLSDPKFKNDYFSCIKKTLSANNHENPIALYKILLSNFEFLEITDLISFLSIISDKAYLFDIELANNLINYFLNVSAEQKSVVLVELKKIIAALEKNIEEFDYEHRYEGLNKLVFSLAVFYFQQEFDEESCSVFLSGIEYVFINCYAPRNARETKHTHFKGRDILKVISPLMSNVDPKILRECINRGSQSKKPELNSLCKLLKTFE